jgi:PTS system mannose-specific IIA component
MACAGQSRRIIYGANLPALIKLAKSRDLPVESAVALALEAGRKYLNAFDISGNG